MAIQTVIRFETTSSETMLAHSMVIGSDIEAVSESFTLKREPSEFLSTSLFKKKQIWERER